MPVIFKLCKQIMWQASTLWINAVQWFHYIAFFFYSSICWLFYKFSYYNKCCYCDPFGGRRNSLHKRGPPQVFGMKQFQIYRKSNPAFGAASSHNERGSFLLKLFLNLRLQTLFYNMDLPWIIKNWCNKRNSM